VIPAYWRKPVQTPRQRAGADFTRQYDKLPPGADIGTAIGVRNAWFLPTAG
jgi:hypothetical protein